MNRSQLAQLGNETVAIAHRGNYVSPTGRCVDLSTAVAGCIAQTQVIRPADWRAVQRQADAVATSKASASPATIEVTPETTLAAARRLVTQGDGDVFALTFASAKNPGGGFLGGSRAQEESLARSSALYPSLLAAQPYYYANRAARTTIYTDHAIYSPHVPVFRDDADGRLLDEPYAVTILTMPAVNVSALRQHGRAEALADEVEETMRRRVGQVLTIAAARGHESLVLGAWGCGVFGNDPRLIAGLFAEALAQPVGRCFRRVTFAVYDTTPQRECFAAFAEIFPCGAGFQPADRAG